MLLHTHEECYFDMLSCLTGLDNGVEKATMEVIYNLYSIPFEHSLMLKIISGEDARDATAATVEVPDYVAELEKGVKGLRIGLSPDYFRITYFNADKGVVEEQTLTDEMKNVVMDAAQRLAKMGAEIVENVPMKHTRYPH